MVVVVVIAWNELAEIKAVFMDYSLTRKDISPDLYQQEYLGKWVAQCAVHTRKGEHCPDKPVHYIEFNGKRVSLCKRCYLNYISGAFNKERAKGIAVEDRLYIG